MASMTTTGTHYKSIRIPVKSGRPPVVRVGLRLSEEQFRALMEVASLAGITEKSSAVVYAMQVGITQLKSQQMLVGGILSELRPELLRKVEDVLKAAENASKRPSVVSIEEPSGEGEGA